MKNIRKLYQSVTGFLYSAVSRDHSLAADLTLVRNGKEGTLARNSYSCRGLEGENCLMEVSTSRQYIQSRTQRGVIGEFCLLDENRHVVGVQSLSPLMLEGKSYIQVKTSKKAEYVEISQCSMEKFQSQCGFDGIAVNGEVFMRFDMDER